MNRTTPLICLGATALVLTGALFTSHRLQYRATDGFSADYIEFAFPFRPDWQIPKEKAEPQELLAQSFSYLGKGARSYAFLGEDGKTVLKFFKYRYHQPHWMVRYLPDFPPFNYLRQKKIGKVSLETVLNGYGIAYSQDPEGTALLHIHLNETAGVYPPVTVFDKQGKAHLIDLDRTRFVLQKKVQEAEDLIGELLVEGNVEEAKKRIGQIFDLYLSHYRQGLCDLGVGILRNNGFDGEKAVHFDVGKLTRDESVRQLAATEQRIVRMAKKIEFWLRINYPAHHDALVSDLQEKLFNLYGVSHDLS